MLLRFRDTLLIVALSGSTAAAAEQEWHPSEGSWHLVAIEEIMESFGKQSFDEFIWVDQHTLWVIRPSYGVKQNLLANTLCGSIADSGQPNGHTFTLKFYDTDAYRLGNLMEHASVTCQN